MENTSYQLYFGLIHATSAISLLSAFLLWSQREKGERSRYFLACEWFLSGVFYTARTIELHVGKPNYVQYFFPINLLIGGFAAIILLLIYPIEVVSPKWLNWKRGLTIFSPWIFSILLVQGLQFFGLEFRNLTNLTDFVLHIHEFNVWIRIPLTILILSFCVILFYVPQNKMRSNTTIQWVRGYYLGVQVIAVFYFGYMSLGIHSVGFLHMICWGTFTAYTTYQELFLRLYIVQERPTTQPIPPQKEVQPYSLVTTEEPKHSVLWQKLEEYMIKEEPWRNPNLSMQLLAQQVGSNRTSLTKAIQDGGYESFFQYIAHYRIQEFCRIIKTDRILKTDDLFYQVGFRSRSTAFSQFKKQMNITPAEYFKASIEESKKNTTDI